MNCLQGFERVITRDEHRNYCLDNESVKVEMPHKNPRVEFCDGQNQFKVLFVMYAVFESLLEPIKGPGDPRASTRGINNHVPSGWCVYSEFAYGRVENPLALYRGEDCVKKFCDHVIGQVHRLYHAFPEKSMKPLTPKEINRYKKSKRCHIFFKPFTGDNPSVRDHCHYTGLCRGAAHRNCNLRYRIPSYIPIVFHNLSGYDTHLLKRELAASVPGRAKMGVIAKNIEDYITFSIKVAVDKYIDKNGVERDKEIELRFIDSFKFMNSSLDSLTTNLVRRGQKLFGFEEYAPSQYEFPIKKGIYPYEYMSEWEKFKETGLPPRETFYSKLNMTGVKDEDYEHPIVFHNLSGYDTHLLKRELAASVPGRAKMGVIAKNIEDYITFSRKVAVDKYIDKNGVERDKEIELRFIDSFKFMNSSLDSLNSNLVRRGQKLFGFEEYAPSQYEFPIKKGIYPYEYMSEWEKFKETELPPREAFYSKLNMTGVKDEDYEHARSVWKEFEINKFG